MTAAVPRDDLSAERALFELLRAWVPHEPRITRLIEALSKVAEGRRPLAALGATGRAADLAAWRAVESARNVVDLPRLLRALGGGTPKHVHDKLTRLAEWRDPRLGSALLRFLEDPKAGIGPRARASWLPLAFELMVELGDEHTAAAAGSLAERFVGIVDTAVGRWICEQLQTVSRSLLATRKPSLPKSTQALCARVEREFAEDLVPPEKPVRALDLETMKAAVFAAPERDGPRHVLADALLAVGDAYGELIALQLQPGEPPRRTCVSTCAVGCSGSGPQHRGKVLAQRRLLHRPLTERELREATLLEQQDSKRWSHPLSLAGEVHFSRGFPAHVRLWSSVNRSIIGAAAWATVSELSGLERHSLRFLVELLAHPVMKNVRSISAISPKVLGELGRRPWTQVDLDARKGGLSARELGLLPELSSLRLDLAEAIGPVAKSPALDGKVFGATPSLRALAVTFHHLEGWSPAALPKLERLIMHRVGVTASIDGLELPPKLEALEVRASAFSGLRAQSRLSSLRLSVSGVPSPDALVGLDALASLAMQADTGELEPRHLEHLPSLRRLEVTVNSMGSVVPLVRRSKLEVLGLSIAGSSAWLRGAGSPSELSSLAKGLEGSSVRRLVLRVDEDELLSLERDSGGALRSLVLRADALERVRSLIANGALVLKPFSSVVVVDDDGTVIPPETAGLEPTSSKRRRGEETA